MNAPTGLLIDPLAGAHAEAVEGVNAWRGRCLASFASVEVRITEVLMTLAATREDVALGQLFGQRVAALEKLVAEDPSARAVTDTLAAFLVHEPLRAFLAHGDAKVTIDRSGRWQVVLTAITLKRRQAHSSFVVIDETEARAIAQALGRDRLRLINSLARWCPGTAGQGSTGHERIALRIGGAAA